MTPLSVITVLKNRFSNFQRCVRHLHQVSHPELVEHVVVDFQSDDGDIPSLYDGRIKLKYIVLEEPFTINRGRNCGIEAAENELIFICDADILVDLDLVRICNESVVKGDTMFFPVMRDLREGVYPDQPGTEVSEEDLGIWRVYGYGMCAFTKTDFLRVGRYNENRFKKWGKDDREFYFRCKRLRYTRIRSKNHKFYHLHHDRSAEFLNRHYNR